MDELAEFAYGQVVWAHIAGFPWWPALIRENNVSYSSQPLHEPYWKHKGRIWVLFFNDNNQGVWVLPNQLRTFTQRSVELFNPLNCGKKFKHQVTQALILAQDYLASKANITYDHDVEELAQYSRSRFNYLNHTNVNESVYAKVDRIIIKRPRPPTEETAYREQKKGISRDLPAKHVGLETMKNQADNAFSNPVVTEKPGTDENASDTETEGFEESNLSTDWNEELSMDQVRTIQLAKLHERLSFLESVVKAFANHTSLSLSNEERNTLDELQTAAKLRQQTLPDSVKELGLWFEKLSQITNTCMEEAFQDNGSQAVKRVKVAVSDHVKEEYQCTPLYKAINSALAYEASSWVQEQQN